MSFENSTPQGTESALEKKMCRRCREIVSVESNYCKSCGAAQKEGLLGRSTLWRDKVVNKSAEMPESFRKVREELLKTIRSRTEGLDMNRIKRFFKKYKLSFEEVIVVSDEDIPRVNELLAQIGANPIDFSNTSCGGKRMASLQISFVYRNKKHEKRFGPVTIERDIVHEASHGSTGYREFIKREKDSGSSYSTSQRVGFSPSNSFEEVAFFEEAFAELMGGKYQDEVYKKANMSRLMKKMFDSGSHLSGKVGRGWLPSKYGVAGDTRIAGIAAFGMELILDQDQDLFKIMIEAREDVDQLREFIKRINKISPGLYVSLRRLKYSQEDFLEGFNMIRKALYPKRSGGHSDAVDS